MSWRWRELEPTSNHLVGNGIDQHYLEWPSKSSEAHLITMLHGCGGNSRLWYPLAARLRERFGDAVRIVALDHRGCGDSEKPRTGYTADVAAADVLAVNKALSERPATVIGHSRGGWLAAYLASHHGAAVRSVVLVDPARMVFESDAAADAFYERVRSSIGPFSDREAAIANLRRIHPTAKITPERVTGLMSGLRERADGSLVGKMPSYVIDQLKDARVHGDVVGPYLRDVSAPTLVLVSSQSNDARQRQKLAYAEGIPNSTVKFFDTSHYLHHDEPDQVADAVQSFLRPIVEETVDA